MIRILKKIPQPVKTILMRIIYLPKELEIRIYDAAFLGKIPFPNKAYIKWNYALRNEGESLNLRHPVTLQDKLSWMKLYYHNPMHTQMVDKYGVRSIVKERIGEEYLVPLLGVYDSFDEIQFDVLPNQFVLKCTHDSGSVVICKDKATFDVQAAKKKLSACLKENHYYRSREWPYKNVKPRIICEPYLKDDHFVDRPDYKFLCFDGEPKMLLVLSDRGSEETQCK